MTPSDLDRFRKLCGLLGSDQVGERAAAALKATDFLEQHGLGWADVALPVVSEPMPVVVSQVDREAMQEARENVLRRARWAQNRHAPDADGFEAVRK